MTLSTYLQVEGTIFIVKWKYSIEFLHSFFDKARVNFDRVSDDEIT